MLDWIIGAAAVYTAYKIKQNLKDSQKDSNDKIEPILQIETGMHIAAIRRIAIDKAERFLVTGSDDKTIRVWELRTGRLLKTLRPPIGSGDEGMIYAVAISPDGRHVAGGGWTGYEWDESFSIYIFDLNTGSLLQRCSGLSDVIFHLAYSKDGRYLAAGLGENGIRIYKTKDYSLIKEDCDYQDSVLGLDFSEDGRLVTTSWDGYIRLYDKNFNLVQKKKAPGGSQPCQISFSPDGSRIAVGYKDTQRVDVLAANYLYIYTLYFADTEGFSDCNFSSVTFSFDNSFLYAGGRCQKEIDGNWKFIIRRWEGAGKGRYIDVPVADNTIMHILPLKDGGVVFGSYEPSWGILNASGRLELYRGNAIADLMNAEEFQVSYNGSVVRFGYEQGGKSIAVFDAEIREFVDETSVRLSKPITQIQGLEITDWKYNYPPKLNGKPITLEQYEFSRSLAIAPDGKSFLLGTEWYLRCFDRNGKEIWNVPAPVVWAVNISGNGKIAVAGFGDGTIRWFGMEDGNELLAFFPHKDRKRWVIWTPKGYYDASPDGEDLIGWHVNKGNDKESEFHPVSEFKYLETAKNNKWFNFFSPDDCSAMDNLESLIGLEPVKKHIRELANLAKVGWVGKEPPSFHMVFTGNPGTGKTTVARLVGEIFRDIGLLKRGHLVECNGRADLVAGYIGQTALKVKEQVSKAMDGVLFIDEAYTLVEGLRGDYGIEAIDQLMQEAENKRDRLVVILAGYTDRMKEFLKTNPGLQSRFPEDNIIEFPDYTSYELLTILLHMLNERGLIWTEDTKKSLKEIIEGLWKTRDKNFGNARVMRNLCDNLYRKWTTRVAPMVDQFVQAGKSRDEAKEEARKEPLRPEDIPEHYHKFLQPPIPEIESLMADLNKMIGLEELKEFIKDLRNLTKLNETKRKRGQQVESRPLHMVFAGNPGTGKTTTARLMGKIFRALGILRKGHLVECSKADVVGEYVGHTPRLVNKKLEEALDGVLFIDEAYSLLGGGNFGKEAIDQLTQQMENLKDRLMVIVAGYPDEMKRFLDSNPGLSSRFACHVPFRDFTRDELGAILKRMAEDKGYKVSQEAMEKAMAYLEVKCQTNPRSFGNARDVRNLLEAMERKLASRCEHPDELEEFIFQPEDVPDVGTTASGHLSGSVEIALVSLLPSEGGPSN